MAGGSSPAVHFNFNKESEMYKVIIYVDGLLAMEKIVDTITQAKRTVSDIISSVKNTDYEIIKI